MNVGMLCTRKTHQAALDETAQVAAERMLENKVGTLVVVDAHHKPVGILTDRDLALRVVAGGLQPREVRVSDVMTAHPRKESAPVEEALETMRSLGVRRLPVVDSDGALTGVLGADDVLEFVASEISSLGRLVGSSRPGVLTPARRVRKAKLETAGLERANADLQC